MKGHVTSARACTVELLLVRELMVERRRVVAILRVQRIEQLIDGHGQNLSLDGVTEKLVGKERQEVLGGER